MSANTDGHSAACKWTKCAHPESEHPCPFLKPQEALDEFVETFAKREAEVPNQCTYSPHGRHEWRQWYGPVTTPAKYGASTYPPQPSGFYCTSCRSVEV